MKSLKINMILNGIKGLLSVFFPLITFPYVSKILGVENIGKYNFANSIVSYFILLAGLGISTYAIREGARIRNDKDKLTKFIKEIFTINVISTAISYVLLFICMLFVPNFKSYSVLIWILSLQILFKTIGVEWIYSIFEDYKYITIRSIIFQILSIVLLFLFVHTEKDLYNYTLITVISSVGSNILNLIHSRKYNKISLTASPEFKKHMQPILILFATTITITIYVNSDITILGLLAGDYHVGLYSLSTKVYTILKSLLASIILVSIPRFSFLLSQEKKEEFKSTAEDVYKTLLTLVIPFVVGIIVLSREIILIISDATYIDASLSLSLLSIAIFFCLGAYFWGQAMLVPLKQEKKVLKITIVSAIVNIVLNILLIPTLRENMAAFTTVIAEAIAFVYCKHETKKIVKLGNFNKIAIKSMLGCIPIIIISFIMKRFISSLIFSTIIIVILSVFCYIIFEILLRNEIVLHYCKLIKNKFKKLIS